MKMEVLSVQNHIQGKFGVNKIKADWPSSGVASTASHQLEGEEHAADVDAALDADVVDGHPASVLHMRQHQALNTRPTVPMAPPVAGSGKQSAVAASFDVVNGSSAAYHHAYMTNVLASTAHHPGHGHGPGPSPMPASPLQSTAGARFGAADNMDDVSASAVRDLSQKLQCQLRDAKQRHLACTEVNLPADLTERIAAEIIRMSDREPCGERACTLFIEFESEPNKVRRIASFKVDPDTVSIFELYLTLKQDNSGWTSKLPQFLKNLTRSNTINISPDFTLTKNKLYSSE
ncbi:protein charybde isoform X1 [Drosophila subobscura]|uniref:protein charybde isoform X1 n=1 Tax=Drosophila subobscura TaxID=7241 RepID=UPI00155B1843|nr:protein charybde isoform X1 [Drosophila subobscura]